MNHFYGWLPDLPDFRDCYYRVRRPSVLLPESIDLRSYCSPVEDQGQLGSCTAQALVGALEFLEGKDCVSFSDLSRLFIYYNERKVEGRINSDSGAMIRTGIKVLKSLGVCPEADWPYDITQFAVKPTIACYTEALNRQITSYERLVTVQEMKSCLAEGFPFVFGFTVYESFESRQVAKTGVVPMPALDERTLGGHAVLGVGYDDSKNWFIVRNSWSSDWGDGGYFYLPMDYLADRNLSDDFWVIRKMEEV